MRRAFTMGDFLNVRGARSGDDLEYGRANVPVNMGGECDPVYGFWEHNRKVPVYVQNGSLVRFNDADIIYTLKYEDRQIILIPEEKPFLDLRLVHLIDLSFDPEDWGKSLLVREIPK